MISLEHLERHATAYLPDENRRAHPAHVQAYYAHCGPESMLALIRVARAAQISADDACIHADLYEAMNEIAE